MASRASKKLALGHSERASEYTHLTIARKSTQFELTYMALTASSEPREISLREIEISTNSAQIDSEVVQHAATPQMRRCVARTLDQRIRNGL